MLQKSFCLIYITQNNLGKAVLVINDNIGNIGIGDKMKKTLVKIGDLGVYTLRW